MTRTSIFILGLAAAISFPTAASASCGTMQGSFIVTCEQGVQVYRHNALSGIPAPKSDARLNLEAEQIRAKTARQRIAAQSRTDARNADLRERELGIKDFEARTTSEALRRSPFAFSTPAYGAGFGTNYNRSRINRRGDTRRRGPKSRFASNY